MNKVLKRTLLSSLVVPFALGVQSANATQITEWGYDVSSTFSNATFSDGDGTPTVSASGRSISWGTTSEQSSVSIEDVSAPGGLMTNGASEEGGNFTHSNRVIRASDSALTGFDLTSALTLNPVVPDGVGSPQSLAPVTFDSSFSETPNRGSCFVGSVSTCDDIFTLNNFDELGGMETAAGFEFASSSFIVEDYSYTVFLELVGLTRLGGACAVAGAPVNCAGLLTQEEQDSSFQTRFRITSTAVDVPEPGTLALLGLGLTGLSLAGRKKAVKA